MFEYFLQAVTTPPTTSDNFVNLLIAIAILIGAIGGIAGTIATVIAQRTKGKAQELAQQVVYVADATGEAMKQVINNKTQIKGIGNVVYALSPDDAKVMMDKANVPIQKLTNDVYSTTDQLNKLATYLPSSEPVIIDANHNGIPDIDEIELPPPIIETKLSEEEKKD